MTQPNGAYWRCLSPGMRPTSRNGEKGPLRRPSAASRRDRGVQQRYDRTAHSLGRGAPILVHSSGDCSAVVKQEQLSSKLLGVACARCLGKVGEEGPKPRSILLCHLYARVRGSRLRSGADELAATKRRPCQHAFSLGEHGQEALSGVGVRGQNARDAVLPDEEVPLQVGAYEVVLAAESVVQRGLGDAGPFDDPVDADHVDAFRIKQLVRRGEQSISRGWTLGSRRVEGLHFGFHGHSPILPTGLSTSRNR